jgi:GNAT superfamily N-acetyltransferase
MVALVQSSPAILAPAIRVREATVFDGARLQAVMARCPQGKDLTVTLVNTPDFFCRAKIYQRTKVFLAEADGEIAGSAAVAVRDLFVGGEPRRVGYEYQFFTAPEHRRRGVAQRLRQAIEEYLAAERVDLTTVIIVVDNGPSERLFGGDGFQPVGDLSLRFLLAGARPRTPAAAPRGYPVRPATDVDLPAVARLIDATLTDHDLSPRVTPEGLADVLRRTPGLTLSSLLVREDRHEIVACAALWEMDRVMEFRVGHVAPELRPAFPAFRPGEALRQWGLTLVGYRTPADLAIVFDRVNDLAYGMGRDQVAILAAPEDPLWRAMIGFRSSEVRLRLHAKALRPRTLPDGTTPLFGDVVDI